MDPAAISSRHRFLMRQYKLASTVLRWRSLARTVTLSAGGEGHGVGAGMTLNDAVANELVGKVILPVLDAAWHTGGQELATKVRTRQSYRSSLLTSV